MGVKRSAGARTPGLATGAGPPKPAPGRQTDTYRPRPPTDSPPARVVKKRYGALRLQTYGNENRSNLLNESNAS